MFAVVRRLFTSGSFAPKSGFPGQPAWAVSGRGSVRDLSGCETVDLSVWPRVGGKSLDRGGVRRLFALKHSTLG